MVKKEIVIAIVMVMLCGAGIVALAGEHPAKKNVVKFVEGGKAYAQQHGRDAFCEEPMNPKGKFIRSQLYLYAYDYKDVNDIIHTTATAIDGQSTDRSEIARRIMQALEEFEHLYTNVSPSSDGSANIDSEEEQVNALTAGMSESSSRLESAAKGLNRLAKGLNSMARRFVV
jgi:hypothetical protein